LKTNRIEIKNVPVNQLKLNPRNPRNNEAAVPEVMRSIQKYGFLVPIVVDWNYMTQAGNTRLKAAMKLKLKTVPVVLVDHLNEEEMAAFAIADNKTGEIASWSFGPLKEILAKYNLKDIPGYTPLELKSYLATGNTDLGSSFSKTIRQSTVWSAFTFVFGPDQYKKVAAYLKTHSKEQAVKKIVEALHKQNGKKA
jgi:ParB-like chromosome segregation protein Spo0J